MNKYLISIMALLVAACSSVDKQNQNLAEPDVVLSRIDNMSERPNWIKESEIMTVQDGYVYFTGTQSSPVDSNVEQLYRVAELNAKSGIAKAIEQKLQFVFQNAEEGYSMDASQARFMGMEATEIMKTGSIRPYKKYWEKILTTNGDGQRVQKIQMFAIVRIPEADFKKAILDAARKREGKGGLSEDFAKKVNSQWDEIVKESNTTN